MAIGVSSGVANVGFAPAAAAVPAPARAGAGPESGPEAGPEITYRPPVAGPVVRPFAPRPGWLVAGHLGVDLAVAPGTAVRAAAGGDVTFAGQVGGALHAVVRHPDGVRTSYSFLATVAVRAGDRVAPGEVVGTSGGTGGGHHGDVLHWGARVGERYVDPMLLLAGDGPRWSVRLVPVDRPDVEPRSTAAERAALAAALDPPPSAPGWLGPASTPGGWRGLLTGARDLVGRSVTALAGVPRAVLEAVPPAWRPPGLEIAVDLPGALASYVRHARSCDRAAPAAAGRPGTRHRLLVVGGLNSASRDGAPATTLATDALGYPAHDVEHYSYRGRGEDYGPADTHGSIEAAAHRLADHLRAMERAEPGREVDLVGHSQGGVVVLAFLALVYDETDPTFPPLGRVATVAAPLAGSSLATAGELVAATEGGRRLVEHAAALTDLPPPGSPGPAELAEGSDLVDTLRGAPLAGHVELTSIGTALDWVVPATHVGHPAASEVHVPVVSATAHSAVLRDPAALAVLAAALEGRPPPCQDPVSWLAGTAGPVRIARIHHAAGLGLGLGGALADPRAGRGP